MDRKRVLIDSEDAELALKLVRLLDRHGVTAFWVTQEEARNWSSCGGWTLALGSCMEMGRWPIERNATERLISGLSASSPPSRPTEPVGCLDGKPCPVTASKIVVGSNVDCAEIPTTSYGYNCTSLVF